MTPIEANKIVYAKAAEKYNELEPHFFPENQLKVKNILKTIRQQSGPKLLDIGCGTGFIIDLAKDLFAEIHGVDISIEMLNRVDTSSGNITLHNIEIENLPFENEYFDTVTAYAVLHHLEDYETVLNEVYKVLKHNGIFYVDLEPNRHYGELVDKYKEHQNENISDIVKNEVKSICHADIKVEEEYGIDGKIFNISEYTRTEFGGIDADELTAATEKIGFRKCEAFHEWYPGQGKVLHQQSEKDAEVIANYSHEIYPLSKSFFKYLRFIITK